MGYTSTPGQPTHLGAITLKSLKTVHLPRLAGVGLGAFWLLLIGQPTLSSKGGSSPTAPAAVAQTPATVAQPPATTGQTLTINGVSVAVPWMQADGKIGIADYGLTDQFGVVLLSTEDPQFQPVQWFSDPSRPITLAAWTSGGYRFLDITPLAQSHSWTITPQGLALQINTPPGQIQAIRREAQPWGERLIIQVTGEPLVQLTEDAGTFSLTLGATPRPGLASTLATSPDSSLTELQITATPTTTRLTAQVSGNAHPQVATGANPSQVVVDIRPDALRPHSIVWAPGLRWQQRYIAVGGQSFPVFWLQITPSQADLTLRPIWADPTTATGTAPLQTMAQRWQATAAINAGFFNRNNQYPLGAVRYNNDWISGPILSRGVVGWNSQGQAQMDRLFLKQTLTLGNGQSFPIQAINSGYVQAGIGLYTPAWGPTYSPVIGNETLVTVAHGQVVNQQLTGGENSPPLPIPVDGYLLAIRSYAAAAQALPPGTGVTIQSELLPASLDPFPNIVGGGPLLIRGGAMVLDPELEQFSRAFATQAAPRSAIGLTSGGDLLLVAAHNSPAGPGPTLNQMAQIMAQLGSTDALNLDGGSSASLYLGGRLINRSPRTVARVNNGIGVFLP
ncbi:MAG: phosphodiester glycosidase family protein [Nodosilinea sp.]